MWLAPISWHLSATYNLYRRPINNTMLKILCSLCELNTVIDMINRLFCLNFTRLNHYKYYWVVPTKSLVLISPFHCCCQLLVPLEKPCGNIIPLKYLHTCLYILAPNPSYDLKQLMIKFYCYQWHSDLDLIHIYLERSPSTFNETQSQ